MREDGIVAWSRPGIAIGARGGSGPVTIAFDGAATFMMAQRVAAVGGDRVVVLRYDGDGEALWASPSMIGALGAEGDARSPGRIEARTLREGAIRVALPHGVAGNPAARAAEIEASGAVRLVAK
jgi:hypothetical protein